MALDVILAIVPTIFEYTFVPIKRHLGYAFNYKSQVENFKNWTEKLVSARERLQHSVDYAVRGGEEIENDVKRWIIGVDKAIEEADKLIKDDQEEATKRCFIGLCPNVKARYNLCKKMEKYSKVIAELQNKGRFDPVSYRVQLQQIVTSSVKNRGALHSRMSVLKEVMDALADPNVLMVGVCGMGGVGKTTLAKEVHQQVIEEKLFDIVVMATVSEKPDIRKIQGNIADVLGLKFDEETETGRAYRLRQRLMTEKKILVILDNIWAQLELEEVGIPCGVDHKGCKILLTSRSRDLLSCDMGVQKVFRLEVLQEEEALSLFEMMVGDVKGGEFQSAASEVTKKCAGLPVLIVTIARALKNKDLYVWKDAVKQLSRCDNEEIQEKVYSALELSYNHLIGAEVKSLFLLCGLLGKSDIAILDLLMYSTGLGLFKGIDTLGDARNRVHKLISDLKAACLLLDSDIKGRVKIHDVVRDVAISIASRMQHLFTVRNGALLKEWPNKDVCKSCTRISLPYNDIHGLPEVLECPELELFLLFTQDISLKVPDLCFELTKNLRVLNFTGMHFSSLPPSLGFLKNLFTLCLDWCALRDVAIIGELTGLTILSFKHSDIVELPREIRQLTKLKFLDLSHCLKLKVIPAKIISELTQLEELYMNNSFDLWDVQGINNQRNASLAELECLPYLTTLEICVLDAKILPKDLFFRKLERFRIFIGDVWSGTGDYGTSRTLKLKLNTSSIHLEHGLSILLEVTEDLYLAEVKGIKSVLYDLDSQGFTQLKHLDVQNDPEIQYIIDPNRRSPCNAFPILESLYLDNLMSLEKICCGKLTTGSFSKLRSLTVVKCDRLKNLFSFSMMRCLLQLQQMKVVDCANLEEIVACGSEDTDNDYEAVKLTQLCSLTLKRLPMFKSFCSKKKVSPISLRVQKQLTTDTGLKEIAPKGELGDPLPLFNEMFCFPNLENLELSSIACEKICDDQLSAISSNLMSLIVERCWNLKYLFTSSLVKNLLLLKRLEVFDCMSVEGIIVAEELVEEERNRKKLFPELDFLKLKNLPHITRFCDGYPVEFSSLRKLLIENCPALNMFVSKSPSADMIESREAKGMNSEKNHHTETQPLFNEKVAFPSLEEIELSYIDNLRRIWHNQLDAGSFCKLKIMRINGCKKLRTIFPSYLLERFQCLEKLSLSDCYALEEIYELQGLNFKEKHLLATSGLRELYIRSLPQLKSILSKDPQGNFTFLNLRLVDISYCSMKNLFPASVATGLLQLEKLVINHCFWMEEIFAKEKGGETAPSFVFLQLTSLELSDLPNFRSFYPGLHTSEWPKLKSMKVFECEKIKNFASEFFFLQGPGGEGQFSVPTQSPIPSMEKGELGISPSQCCMDELRLEPIENIPGDICENDPDDGLSSMFQGEMLQQLNNNNFPEFSDRNAGNPPSTSSSDKSNANAREEGMAMHLRHPTSTHEEPGIEGIQIIGDAIPGERLIGCGYPVGGTSLCMFQWFCQLEDGTKQYIKGATYPEYVVTANDANKQIGLDCLPMDDQGLQGKLVTVFADDPKNVECDGPSIEGFQIIGNAMPGERLLACGYSVGGTSRCVFQWFCQLEDGSRQYIEGAIYAEYTVTTNDVDKLIGVVCRPEDDQGHKGKLVTTFANDQKKIKREGPSIEAFQISGDAMPGNTIHACGYSVGGTSDCMFQWVRHLEDGSKQYIVGATEPHYVVTADDVDKLISVECIPLDDQGHQGKLMRLFANDQKKIQCDAGMQRKIDTYSSICEATFGVLLMMDSFDNWEPANLVLRQAGYQIKGKSEENVVIAEKFSKELLIKIPYGLSKQFILECFDGSSHTLSTYDSRMRDTVVLTMRMFLSKFLNSFKVLVVEKCNALEALFDVEGSNIKEGHAGISQLNELHLIELPRLRFIWNKKSRGALGFKNLTVLKIHDCNCLANMFTLSMSLGLVQLQYMEVKRCPSMEEIITKGEEQVLLDKPIFPSLYYINFESLPCLRSFYSGSDAIECPSLEKVVVVDCPKMEAFSSKFLRERGPLDKRNTNSFQGSL
eukprot:XP_015576965.1 uncharacterized protein LOC8266842 isoform X2 [Ricinus communis]